MSVIGKELGNNLTIKNFEVFDQYDQLVAEGKNPFLALRKTWRGKKVLLIAEKEPVSLRHPLSITSRVSNLWDRLKTAAFQKVSIDTVQEEKIADFRTALFTKIQELADQPSILHLANQINGIAALQTENDQLKEQVAHLEQVMKHHKDSDLVKAGLEEKLRKAKKIIAGLDQSVQAHGFKKIQDFVVHHTSSAESVDKKHVDKKNEKKHFTDLFTHHATLPEVKPDKAKVKPTKKQKEKSGDDVKEAAKTIENKQKKEPGSHHHFSLHRKKRHLSADAKTLKSMT